MSSYLKYEVSEVDGKDAMQGIWAYSVFLKWVESELEQSEWATSVARNNSFRTNRCRMLLVMA